MTLDHQLKVYSTKHILNDLNEHIKSKSPFSTIRYGDAVYGIVATYACPDLINEGKWCGLKGKKLTESILGQLTIPPKHRLKIINRVIKAADNANYCDSYLSYSLLKTRTLGIIGRKWKEIHECAGIKNKNYCSCFLHYFSMVDGEFNLFDIMKERRIFCITSKIGVLEQLKKTSGAKEISGFRIPSRGRKGKHYKEYFKKVIQTIRTQTKNYDLFLIGAGILGKIYCEEVRKNGGAAFDSGRLFDFWFGRRSIDSRPKRYIKYNNLKMLCDRIKHGEKTGVW